MDNIPIERGWHWLHEQIGHNLYHHITHGQNKGYFNPNDDIYV